MKSTAQFAAIALSAALSFGSIAAPLSGAEASQPRSNHFSAQLVEPTEEDTAIAGGVVFRCEGTTCIGPRSGDRPLRVCSELRREVGTIASFTINGEAMSDRMLGRCNG